MMQNQNNNIITKTMIFKIKNNKNNNDLEPKIK